MKVIGWSPHLTPERAAAAGVTFIATKEELIKSSDIVSIHIVLSESTRHLVTADDLALMKPSALFINTSRGPIVDEQALVKVLQEKRIAGAGLDVFDLEPLPLDHPLRDLENVTLSPHLGYVSDDNYKVKFSLCTSKTGWPLTMKHRFSGLIRWTISLASCEGRLNEPECSARP